jgi:hypothetical protein
MLQPIDDANLGQAVDLLAKGFPRGSRRFWEQGVERVARYNAWSKEPEIGQLLIANGKPAGVILTLHSHSLQACGARYKVTNLSSWYVDPQHRHLAPLMLRKLMRASDTVFTDLSPSDRVIPMLGPLGFRPLNAGLVAIALPLAAFRTPRGGSVIGLEDVNRAALSPSTRELFERHVQFGALAAVLSADGRHVPLLFIERTIRKLPAVQLVYCDDNRLFCQHMGAVARFLLKRRKPLMIIDIPPGGAVPGVAFVGRGMKFAKGGYFENRTDYAGSELLVLNL